MRGRGALLVAICAGSWALPAAGFADAGVLYQWTDEQGVVRYTPDRGRVPRSARDVQEITAPTGVKREADGAPAVPGALPAVMGSKLPEDLVTSDQPPPATPDALEARIAELREAIARDQATLEELVAATRKQDAEPDEARLQAIANRLPVMRTELLRLEKLQSERAAGTAAP